MRSNCISFSNSVSFWKYTLIYIQVMLKFQAAQSPADTSYLDRIPATNQH